MHSKQSLLQLNRNKNKQRGMIEMVLLVLGLVAVIGAGAAFYMMNKKGESSLPKGIQQTSQTAESTSVYPSDDLEAELDAILLEDIDEDFKEIDADLSSL